ncbi:MAG: PD-(D/E)XK nuclease family protein [Cytophagaceae bacterium]
MKDNNINLQEIAFFLDSFSEHIENSVAERVAEDLNGFKDLFGRMDPLMQKVEKELTLTAPEYNIFEIINLSRYETRLHTPFLVHLLNPSGSHHQKRLFFDGFIAHISPDINLKDITDIRIYEEYPAEEYGRIDILILYKYNNKSKALIVENKIYSVDGQNQLSRYYNFLTERLKINKDNFQIVYLTPHKSMPSEWSIDKDLYADLKKERVFFELGYKENVAPILQNTISTIKAEPVKQVIKQYLQTVNIL